MPKLCMCSYARPHGKPDTTPLKGMLSWQPKHLATATYMHAYSIGLLPLNAGMCMYHCTTVQHWAWIEQQSLTLSNTLRWRVGPGTRQFAGSPLLACQPVARVTRVQCHCFVSGVSVVHTAVVNTHRFTAVDSFLALWTTICGSYNTHYTVLIKYWLLAGSIYRIVFRPTGKFMCHVVYRMITSGHLLCVVKVNNAARAIKVLHIISVAVAMFFAHAHNTPWCCHWLHHHSLRSFRQHVAMWIVFRATSWLR